KFGADAHRLFGARAGAAIWQPEMTAFLASIGMPHQVQPAMAKYGQRASVPAGKGECRLYSVDDQVVWEPR
ncbi:MAG: hypothetical protein JWQ07_3001, partial [Ramlibacter sp.]|nr:hypothetical protein [Ramlibacter sp.]